MTHPTINTEQLPGLLAEIKGAVPSASSSHLPTSLPLAFPTPLHTLNTLTTQHLVYAVLSHPQHAAYFRQSGAIVRDTTTRGVFGLYLSSGEEWNRENLLSSAAWGSGAINEDKIREYFGIETTQEREHETMKGIKVGGRWEEGARVAAALTDLFHVLGQKLGGAKCVGEVVKDVLESNSGEADSARTCCEQAVALVPSLADPHKSKYIPVAPLRLLQDLAVRQEQHHDLYIQIPTVSELSNVSPLPIPIELLIRRGVLTTDTPGVESGDMPLDVHLALIAASQEVSVALHAIDNTPMLDLSRGCERLCA